MLNANVVITSTNKRPEWVDSYPNAKYLKLNFLEKDSLDLFKLQKEKLNRSFDLLIIESKKLNNNDNFEMNTAEVQKKTMLFNESIKAYVDVCCQTPGLVS